MRFGGKWNRPPGTKSEVAGRDSVSMAQWPQVLHPEDLVDLQPIEPTAATLKLARARTMSNFRMGVPSVEWIPDPSWIGTPRIIGLRRFFRDGNAADRPAEVGAGAVVAVTSPEPWLPPR